MIVPHLTLRWAQPQQSVLVLALVLEFSPISLTLTGFIHGFHMSKLTWPNNDNTFQIFFYQCRERNRTLCIVAQFLSDFLHLDLYLLLSAFSFFHNSQSWYLRQAAFCMEIRQVGICCGGVRFVTLKNKKLNYKNNEIWPL